MYLYLDESLVDPLVQINRANYLMKSNAYSFVY